MIFNRMQSWQSPWQLYRVNSFSFLCQYLHATSVALWYWAADEAAWARTETVPRAVCTLPGVPPVCSRAALPPEECWHFRSTPAGPVGGMAEESPGSGRIYQEGSSLSFTNRSHSSRLIHRLGYMFTMWIIVVKFTKWNCSRERAASSNHTYMYAVISHPMRKFSLMLYRLGCSYFTYIVNCTQLRLQVSER